MKGTPFTPEEKQWLHDHAKRWTFEKLTENFSIHFDRSAKTGSIKSLFQRNGWSNLKHPEKVEGLEYKIAQLGRKNYEQLKYIHERYKTV